MKFETLENRGRSAEYCLQGHTQGQKWISNSDHGIDLAVDFENKV